MSEFNKDDVTEPCLSSGDDYQVECMQVEPDSVHSNYKCHSQDL